MRVQRGAKIGGPSVHPVDADVDGLRGRLFRVSVVDVALIRGLFLPFSDDFPFFLPGAPRRRGSERVVGAGARVLQ